MRELELFKILRTQWLERVVKALDKNSSLQDELSYQLEHFYTLMEQALETGDPAWLDSTLSMWAYSLTQSDLEMSNSNLTNFINELLLLTYNVIQDNLSPREVADLTSVILPLFTYASQKAAKYEVEHKMEHAMERLHQVQVNLERLDKSKSDFISVAAHELKTPLTLIQGYAAMLQENLEKKKINESDRILLEGIHNGVGRLHLIIDDMIDVSLIDNDLLQLNFQPIWIDRIFEALSTEVRPILSDRSQTLICHPFEGSHEMIFGDPERLTQVFRNLLTNAIKFTPDGGKIEIDGRKLPGFVEITITDNGIGIDAEEQAFIFEKFHRVGNTILHSSSKTKFKGGGPGLGLHIAKGIVEAHGGSTWVDSLGHDENNCPGSTFHVMLPIRKESADPKMSKLFGTINPNHSSEQDK